MVDSPSPPHNDRRSSRSRSPSSSSRSSAVRNGTSHHNNSSSKEYSSNRSKGYGKETIKIVQVANIAPQATREQMQALFGYVGKIDDIRLYPTVDIGMQLQSKICFVKFYDVTSVGSAQHLTNTVFIDRALIVIPYLESEIPDESKALDLLGSGSLLPGIADPKLPQHVTSQLEGIPPLQVVVTKDPRLAERGLPPYPPLAPTVDSRKIEEIRRTVIVCNLSHDTTTDAALNYFSRAGEVKYFRFCTRDNDPLKYALIEFTEQPSVLEALMLNGQTLDNKVIRVYHSTQAIIKPQAKTNEAAQKEIEEAMSRQAQNMLTHGLDSSVAPSVKEKRRSRTRSRSHGRRSRSRGRRRSRSRSLRRRSRSRSNRRSSSRHRDKYRSTKVKRSRSRSSRERERRRSRSKKRSRSPRRRRSRSGSYTRVRRSRSRSKKRDEKKKSKKDKERDKDRDKERNKDRDRDHKENGEESDNQKKEKKSERRSRSPKPESKKRRRSRSRSHPRKVRSPSHEKKRSKNKKKKKDTSDRELSIDSVGHSRSNSLEKRSKKGSPMDMDYDDDASRSNGDIDEDHFIKGAASAV